MRGKWLKQRGNDVAALQNFHGDLQITANRPQNNL
jgi:hypothetical protein